MLSSESFVCYFDLHNFLVPKAGCHIVDVIQIKSDIIIIIIIASYLLRRHYAVNCFYPGLSVITNLYTIFKIGKLVLYLSLLRITIVWLSFEFTQLTCSVHKRCSSKTIPTYFTVLKGVSLLLLSLNLTP